MPLGRRVLYAIAAYTGQRKASLFELHWKHADFDHGTLASFKTKTGRAQYFVADRGLMAVLEGWKVHKAGAAVADEIVTPSGAIVLASDAPGPVTDDAAIVTDADVGYDRKRLATALRDDLKAVGVTRAILFEEDAPNVEPLRFHDLRSTFCTWARRHRTRGSRSARGTSSPAT